MLGKIHIVLGIIVAGCIINTNDLETNLIAEGASIVGSLMPDICYGGQAPLAWQK